MRTRIVRTLLAAAVATACLPLAALADDAVVVHVVDAATRAPIAGARIDVAGRAVARSDERGVASVDAPAGATVRASADGFAPAERTVPSASAQVEIALPRRDRATDLPAIGSVRANGAASPGSPTISTTLGSRDLLEAGAFRLADALVALPAINATAANRTAQNSAPGSSIYVDMRGFGSVETTTLIDGHPIGQGIDLGFNFQDAAVFAFRDVAIGYGTSANGVLGIGNIGGVIDMRTLEPTQRAQTTLLQGIGSYGRATTAFTATGMAARGRLGYAAAFGVEGQEGPIAHQTTYVPGASFDPSSPAAAIRAAATYPLDQSTVRRSALGKLRLTMGDDASLTVHAFSNTSWADGSGNSDNIYLSPAVALAQANRLLSAKAPGDTCPAGSFTALDGLGLPQGLGPNFRPDGGITCQTPAQYAAFSTGYQGIGPHTVSFRASDYGARLLRVRGIGTTSVDAYANSYLFDYDRSGYLTLIASPHGTGFAQDQLVGNVGVIADHRLSLGAHELAFGYRANNETDRTRIRLGFLGIFGADSATSNTIYAFSQSYGVEDRWRLGDGRTAIQGGVAYSSSTATHTGYADPHLAVRTELGPDDALRVSAGSVSVQPPTAWLGTSFVPAALTDFASALSCGGTASVGSIPSSSLRPERGVDQEVSWTHRFAGATFAAAAYNAQLFDKIYDTTVPLSALHPGTIPATALTPYQNALAAACGTAGTLGATGYVNIGQVTGRGIVLQGDARVGPRWSVNAAWSVEASTLRSANADLLAANLALIPGAQLPNVPLHKASLGIAYRAPAADAALTFFNVDRNNPANLPRYTYANARAGARLGNGRLQAIVNNVFNQYPDARALVGVGEPLALNAYAQPGDYAPLIGAVATTQYGLGPRRFQLYYQLGTR